MKNGPHSVVAILLMMGVACGDSDGDQEAASGAGASCTAKVQREHSLCPQPADDLERNVALCEDDRDLYGSAGCREEYDAFVVCATTTPDYACDEGPSACLPSVDRYQLCSSEFARTTGCAASGRRDNCPEDKPWGYTCLGAPEAPSPKCVESDGASQLGHTYCCPAYDTW